MFNATKKMLTILMIIIFASAIFIGCAKTEPASDDTSGGTAASTASNDSGGASADDSANVEMDPFGKYESPIEINVVASVSEQLQKNTLKTEYTVEDNPWTDAYEERLGIILKYLWVASSDDEYSMKLNLSLSSGEMPDMVSGIDEAITIKQLKDGDALIEVKTLYEQYGSPLLNKLVESVGEEAWLVGAFEGDYYALPNPEGNYDFEKFLWIRKDWLENVNLSAPANYDDFMNIVEAFATKDPDMNGKDDTYGLAFCKDLLSYFADIKSFINLYHGYLNIWIEKDGELIYGAVQPEVKQALGKLSEMYELGYLDSEFGIKDNNKIAEDFVSGKQGLAFGDFWASLDTSMSNTVTNDENADFIPVPIAVLGVDGEPVYCSASSGCGHWTVITKECEHPEAIIKMANLYTELTTNEYSTYGVTADGREMWQLGVGFNFCQVNKNLKIYQAIRRVMAEGGENDLAGEQLQIYDNVKQYMDGDRSMWSWYRIFGPEGINEISEAGIEKYSEQEGWLTPDMFNGAPTQTMTEKQSILDTMWEEEYIKIIIGDAPLDDFDSFVAEWGEAGGNQMTQEVNEWYASTQK